MDPNDTPTPTVEEQAVAAMTEGVDAATPEPAPEPPPDTPSAPEGQTTPEPTPEPVPGEEAPKPEPEAQPDEIAAEADKLGLKGKANERFRDMAKEIKELSPVKELLEKAGIKDAAAELPKVLEKAKAADDLIGMIMDTGISSEQFGATLDYYKMLNSGSLDGLDKAFDLLMGELQKLGKAIGREVPGAVDPLDDHADLKAQMEAGDLPRNLALEQVKLRARDRITTTRQEAEHTAAQAAAARDQGRIALNALGAELTAADPQFQAKAPYLMAALETITQALPPEQWAAAARQAYARIPAPPVATKPAPGPMRQGAQVPALAPVTDDPYAAMEIGIAQANAA